MTSTNTRRSAWGVDGCKAGWFFFRLGPPSGNPPYGVVERLEEVVAMAGNEDSILVDIPIGLPDRAGPNGRRRETAFRACDEAARDKLGNRKSSVFPVPVRPVMEALRKERRWSDVRNTLKRTTLNGRTLSVNKGEGRITAQSFAILPKIIEVDDLLQSSDKACSIVRETHPEVCFRVLVGDDRKERLSTFSKKHGLGFLNRVAIVESCYPGARCAIFKACEEWPRVASDDIVDAMACAVTATARDELEALSGTPPEDSKGRPMEIVYASGDAVRRAYAVVTASHAP